MILDDAGQVVWFHPLDTHGVTDFRVQRYRGRPVLTWWRGETAKGIGNGRYVIADDSYHVIANVTAGQRPLRRHPRVPHHAAEHGALHRLPPACPYDLSALGGPEDGKIEEGVVQEVDIPTGRVLFEWHSAAARRRRTSRTSRSRRTTRSRSTTSTSTRSSRTATGRCSSRRGTRTRSTRSAAATARSSGGSAARRATSGSGPARASRGSTTCAGSGRDALALRQRRAAGRRGKRVARARPPARRAAATRRRSSAATSTREPLLSTSQGNAQFLPDGHVFVGWGSNEYFTEFDRARPRAARRAVRRAAARTRTAPTASRGSGTRPTGRRSPRVREGGGTLVYASWNGATEVDALARARRRERVASRVGRRGVQERLRDADRPAVPAARYVEVQALDAARPRAPRTSQARARRRLPAEPARYAPSRRARPSRGARSGRTRALHATKPMIAPATARLVKRIHIAASPAAPRTCRPKNGVSAKPIANVLPNAPM